MATLSLKKPKKIGDTPLPNLQDKFVVVHQSRGWRAFRFTVYHDTFEQAKKEAGRLSKTMPGCRFLVLEVKDLIEWEA